MYEFGVQGGESGWVMYIWQFFKHIQAITHRRYKVMTLDVSTMIGILYGLDLFL